MEIPTFPLSAQITSSHAPLLLYFRSLRASFILYLLLREHGRLGVVSPSFTASSWADSDVGVGVCGALSFDGRLAKWHRV